MKFIVNLNGTILCPYQLLLDLAEQLPNCPAGFKHLAFKPICDLNSTNDWINLESLGKPVALRSKTMCDAFSALLKKQLSTDLVIDIYLGKNPLSSDNLFSLIYLAQSANSLKLNFFTDTESQPDLIEKIEALTDLDGLSIHYRTDTHLADLSTLTQLKTARDTMIKNLGFQFEDDFLAKAQIPDSTALQIIGYAWMCLKSGAYEIACRLLEKTHNHKNNSPAIQEQLFMHLLMIRFFSHQYALVTESEFPNEFQVLTADELRTLQFLKAYSATLSRNLLVAHEFFDQCNINSQMPLTDETSLYQLNLFALSRVLRGEIELAFELEFRIKSFIEEQQIQTVGLKYVNFINIARLYKKTKEYDRSLDYYNKAYNEISGGGYATSDHIYYHMNLGSLYEAAEDYDKALDNWVKAAIHWLACKNKYELSWRPRLILCSETINDVQKPLPVDKANLFLVQKIKELIHRCGKKLSDKDITRFQFRDDLQNIKKDYCFISNSILLYTSEINNPTLDKSSFAEHELAHLITLYLHSLMDIPEQQNVFIIDTHWDDKPILKAEEAMAYAKLSHCSNCYFNGQWLKLEQFAALKPMNVSLAKVIESILQTDKGLSLQYKRSFLNKTLLDQDEINWVNKLDNKQSLSLGNLSHGELHVVQQLVKKRVLNFSYPWA